MTPSAARDGVSEYIVVGSGIGGLSLAALLARWGRGVIVLEADSTHIGGYARTFRDGDYRYTLGPRYVWDFHAGAIGARFLEKIGLEHIDFVRLDEDGFDHVHLGGDEPVRVPMGWTRYRDVLARMFPAEAKALHAFFDAAAGVFRVIRRWQQLDLYYQPPSAIVRELLRRRVSVGEVSRFLRYATCTLQDVYDRAGLGPRLRAILSAQVALNLESPSSLSFLAYVGAVLSYHDGACYPADHFEALISSIAAAIRNDGGQVLTGMRVTAVRRDAGGGFVVQTSDGGEFRASSVISNIDPQATCELVAPAGQLRLYKPAAADYGGAVLSMFFGFRGNGANVSGLGRANSWYLENEAAPEEVFGRDCDFSAAPRYAYVNCPTLLSPRPGIAPAGSHVVTAFVPCTYRQFAEYEAQGDGKLEQALGEYRNVIGEFLDRTLVPGLQNSTESCVMKTPVDCEREIGARQGNAYGARFTRRVVFPRVRMTTPVPDLYLLSAFTSLPGLIPGILGAAHLYYRLTGDRV